MTHAVKIPVSHASSDQLTKEHPGWWAVIGEPSWVFGAAVGTELWFIDTLNGDLVARGTLEKIVPPGTVHAGDERFTSWFKIVFRPLPLHELATV